MPLDLVGKLHRTVYICGCPDDAQEDLARLLLQRCGAIEAWDGDAQRMTVVFRSVNSISNALTFDGMSYVDLTRKLVVWRATERAPAQATQQLAIAAAAAAANNDNDNNNTATAVAVVETAEERARRAEARQRRRAAVQELLQQHNRDAEKTDYSIQAHRDAKMLELCKRQLHALCVLTEAAVRDEQRMLAEKQEQLRVAQALLASTQAKYDATATTGDSAAAVTATSAPGDGGEGDARAASTAA